MIKPAYACTLRRVCISCSLLRNGTTGANYQSELVAISRRQSVDIKAWVERIESRVVWEMWEGEEIWNIISFRGW